MKVTGQCYCGNLKYDVEGDPLLKVACHCRECQYIAGGSANLTMGMPENAFSYTAGEPKQFSRPDLENAVTREFCSECGTHMLTRAPQVPGVVLLKVGTMDDPSQFAGPQLAIYTCEKQGFHQLPEGVPAFDKFPG